MEHFPIICFEDHNKCVADCRRNCLAICSSLNTKTEKKALEKSQKATAPSLLKHALNSVFVISCSWCRKWNEDIHSKSNNDEINKPKQLVFVGHSCKPRECSLLCSCVWPLQSYIRLRKGSFWNLRSCEACVNFWKSKDVMVDNYTGMFSTLFYCVWCPNGWATVTTSLITIHCFLIKV